MGFKIGSGYDVHRLVSDRKLILGGVVIPFDRGLKGHSDADVLVHAICDAILGASGDGDIGRHFPDTDPAFKGISSLVLLEKCCKIISEKKYTIGNIDCTVFAQSPRMEPYKHQMEINIAAAAGITVEDVNVKATTTEGLGFVGRGEGIEAHAVVLLLK